MSALKKCKKFFKSAFKYCGIFSIFPIIVEKGLLWESGFDSGWGQLYKIIGVILLPFALVALGITLPLGLVGLIALAIGATVAFSSIGAKNLFEKIMSAITTHDAEHPHRDPERANQDSNVQSSAANVIQILSASAKSPNNNFDPGAFTAAMQEYLKSFEGKPANTKIVQELNILADELRKEFDGKHFDSATQKLMDIPVKVNDNYYDLKYVEAVLSKLNLRRCDIQPAQEIAEEIQKCLKRLQDKYASRAKNDDAIPDSNPKSSFSKV